MIPIIEIISTILLTSYNVTAFDIGFQSSIYAINKENNLLIKYSNKGDSLASVGGFGSSESGFDSPVAVATTESDVFVADYNNHRIQRFNRDLTFISSIYLREDNNEYHRFGYPLDLAVLRSGNLAILDGENKRIVLTTPFGEWLNTYVSNDTRNKLLDPISIKVDSEDNLYILDKNKILMFNPFGNFVKYIPFPTDFLPAAFDINADVIAAVSGNFVCLYNIKNQAFDANYSLQMQDNQDAVLAKSYKKIGLQFEGNTLFVSSGNRIISYNLGK